MEALKKIGKKTVLTGTAIDNRYKVGFLRKDWPFLENMQVYTKTKTNPHIPIGLDHETREFVYRHGTIELRGNCPYNILKQMALRSVVGLSTAAQNWGALWVTVDNGATYVMARELNHHNCTENGVALREDVHQCVPSD